MPRGRPRKNLLKKEKIPKKGKENKPTTNKPGRPLALKEKELKPLKAQYKNLEQGEDPHMPLQEVDANRGTVPIAKAHEPIMQDTTADEVNAIKKDTSQKVPGHEPTLSIAAQQLPIIHPPDGEDVMEDEIEDPDSMEIENLPPLVQSEDEDSDSPLQLGYTQAPKEGTKRARDEESEPGDKKRQRTKKPKRFKQMKLFSWTQKPVTIYDCTRNRQNVSSFL